MDQDGATEKVQTKVTLHERILRDIESRILSGEWPPGTRIPFEVNIARQYRCSRMTVNKVLTQLAHAGLIERRRRSGSRVTRPRAQSAVLEIRDIQSEVQSLGLAYSYALLSRSVRKSGESDRTRLDLPPGTPVLELACLHEAAAWPFCYEERLINLSAVPAARDETFEHIAPGQWLLDNVPWSAAQHVIRALAADPKIAARLELSAGAPCLVIERRTYGGETNITEVRLTYPGASHELAARFTPVDAPRGLAK